MSKRPGLTEAMRMALIDPSSASRRMCERLADEGLLFLFAFHREVSPRGQAALAAPRVTAAELACLRAMERAKAMGAALWVHDGQWSRSYQRCRRNGWAIAGELTDAGTTALNNMRAAMGSAEWKP